MPTSYLPSILLLASGLFSAVAAGKSAHGMRPRDGPSPALPHSPDTSTYCTWWVDVQTATTCDAILSTNFITLAEFRRWNPSLTPACAVEGGKSYCVEVFGEPVPSSSTTPTTKSTTFSTRISTSTKATSTKTTTRAPTTTSKPLPTTTKTGNGITTPTPIQTNMVKNCDRFYKVKSGDTCAKISASNGVTVQQLTTWNPAVKSDCSAMWLDYYICTSIVGHTPTTPTTATNGITTPTPIQTNMVKNCDRFYKVKSGDTCAKISASNGVTTQQLTTWNPAVKSDCSALWLDYYICTSIVGHTPTTPGNGVQTPTPFQTGMTKSCKTFHLVTSGQTCQVITTKYKITQANFLKWNPAVKSDCTGMWANAYVCIAVL
ncbi:LysM domain-containing protein [Rhexocercosporidium sp. MPI-PUGE-AT-0058]|nr:LysM domain-containing protein [Rhexocercosporidium sp. MPI-PUGE-AT-0058]